jgi:hypothetical protein
MHTTCKKTAILLIPCPLKNQCIREPSSVDAQLLCSASVFVPSAQQVTRICFIAPFTMASAYRPPMDIAALRDYVTGPGGGMQRQSESTVLLQVTHCNLKTQFLEIRLDMNVRLVCRQQQRRA